MDSQDFGRLIHAHYLEALEHSYTDLSAFGQNEISRREYLANYIFDFNTYDGEMDEIFAAKAVEVCRAITERTTFAYIENPEDYRWYLIMCHMPFFSEKLEWGTSIRGAWWDSRGGVKFQSCGIFHEGEQFAEAIEFSESSWPEFIKAVLDFAAAGEGAIA